jgi:hypothetical protein
MIAYYYHDENFIDKKECDNNPESNSENNEEANNDAQVNEELNDSEESGSFFKEIFKNFKK